MRERSRKMSEKKIAPTIPEIIRHRRSAYLINQDYLNLLLRLIVLIIILYVLFNQVFLIDQANGNGMFPAVKDGDLMVAYRLESDLSKNDVVFYTHEGGRHVGRILGRPGDVVTINDSGTLMVNGTTQSGEILYPTYKKEGLTYPYTVPDDSYFILGDYRTQCEDSRDFGAVNRKDVEGKVITILRRRSI